jgi:hypothetical protein
VPTPLLDARLSPWRSALNCSTMRVRACERDARGWVVTCDVVGLSIATARRVIALDDPALLGRPGAVRQTPGLRAR